MLETTTVISYKHTDGLYKMGEVFIYKSPTKTIRLIVVDSDGFQDPIEVQHITEGFDGYIETMFGYGRYILMFNHNTDIYIYKKSAETEMQPKIREMFKSNTGLTAEIEQFVADNEDYFV